MTFSASRTDAIGIVERGSAALIRIDEEGVSTVLEEMGPGGVFGRDLAFAGSAGDSLEVVARTPCDILFIDYPHLFRRCENACTHHSILVQNMLGLLSDKAQALSERVDVLSRRSIREKLLCYFRQQAGKSGGDAFTLPFSFSVLADYIATDRSAMMPGAAALEGAGIPPNGRSKDHHFERQAGLKTALPDFNRFPAKLLSPFLAKQLTGGKSVLKFRQCAYPAAGGSRYGKERRSSMYRS